MNNRNEIIFKLGVFAAAAILITTNLGANKSHGWLTVGLLGLWICLVWGKHFLEQRWLQQNGGRPTYQQNVASWAVGAILALVPGLILIGYGWLAPVQPSLTNSGVDVCEFEVGYCVSGTRAFIFIGGLALLIGLVWSYFMFTVEKKANR